jgi:hypothetical protein
MIQQECTTWEMDAKKLKKKEKHKEKEEGTLPNCIFSFSFCFSL